MSKLKIAKALVLLLAFMVLFLGRLYDHLGRKGRGGEMLLGDRVYGEPADRMLE